MWRRHRSCRYRCGSGQPVQKNFIFITLLNRYTVNPWHESRPLLRCRQSRAFFESFSPETPASHTGFCHRAPTTGRNWQTSGPTRRAKRRKRPREGAGCRRPSPHHRHRECTAALTSRRPAPRQRGSGARSRCTRLIRRSSSARPCVGVCASDRPTAARRARGWDTSQRTPHRFDHLSTLMTGQYPDYRSIRGPGKVVATSRPMRTGPGSRINP